MGCRESKVGSQILTRSFVQGLETSGPGRPRKILAARTFGKRSAWPCQLPTMA